MRNQFIFILIFIRLYYIKTRKCKEENCLICSGDNSICYKCKEGFINHYSVCGIKCNSIINCQLCNAQKTKCVKCKSNCYYNGIKCNCTERYILTVVCILIAITTISVTCLCLMNINSRRIINNMYFYSGHLRPSIFNTRIYNNRYNLSEEENSEIENKINEIKIISDFNRNKIKEGKNIEKKKCVICKANDCNLKLNCGCYICFPCEKKCIKTNICLNCKKSIESMQQVSCSICLCNKKEISTFNCPCKTVICKECYIKWRKQNNFCPSCRMPIFGEY